MNYALRIGLTYLRSKKRSTVSVITVVAIAGVAVGVAAFLAVLSIASGFQDEFRNKVLGVNAHVLIMKYGLDFGEYRDVIATSKAMPEVAGAAPFVINEMMLAKGQRISGVLVKGVDPVAMPTVLDLPSQLIDGSLDGLRLAESKPPKAPKPAGPNDDDLDAFLAGLADAGTKGDDLDAGLPPVTDKVLDAVGDRVARGDKDILPPSLRNVPKKPDAPATVVLPTVHVPTPEEMAQALADLDASGKNTLPDEDSERQIFDEEALDAESGTDTKKLPGMVLGATLARHLGIGVGDVVRLISPLAGLDTSMWEATPRVPRLRDFRVSGIFEAGFQEYDSRLVYVDLYEAQAFFDQGDTVTGVELRLHDLTKSTKVARSLEDKLGAGPIHTLTWQELNQNLFTALEIQKRVLSLVIATIVCVAAFNVIATLIMMVLEKKREIAILKAMGARNGAILTIFFVQGTVIGLVGTAIGLVLGGGVVAYLHTYEFPLDPKVYLIDHLPVRVGVTEFVVTVLVALAICMLATLFPSWWAARMRPVDGVRYE